MAIASPRPARLWGASKTERLGSTICYRIRKQKNTSLPQQAFQDQGDDLRLWPNHEQLHRQLPARRLQLARRLGIRPTQGERSAQPLHSRLQDRRRQPACQHHQPKKMCHATVAGESRLLDRPRPRQQLRPAAAASPPAIRTGAGRTSATAAAATSASPRDTPRGCHRSSGTGPARRGSPPIAVDSKPEGASLRLSVGWPGANLAA